KGAATHGFLRQFAKPPFHLIEPTRTGRNEMEDKAGVVLEPKLHLGVFVRAVIIQNQMQLQFLGKLLIQSAQKFQEFLVAMPRKALANDFSLQNLQRRKQRRGSVT